MTIQEFLEMSAGKWFSQRTSHQLTNQSSTQGNTEIFIELLAADHAEITKICQEHQIEASCVTGGIKVLAKPIAQWNAPAKTPAPSATTLLVPVADPNQPLTGQILWTTDGAKMPIGKFAIDEEEALNLSISNQSWLVEERIWFASPNLRLRTNIQKDPTGYSLASFCSEIRMGGS